MATSERKRVQRNTGKIIVASGLPRSGTSLLMQMLAAGGIDIVTDGLRQPDEENPRGYFELEEVKRLALDPACLARAVGGAIKITSPLLPYLPQHYTYDVVFMLRRVKEVLWSQRRMLATRGEPSGPDDGSMARLFREHIAQTLRWLSAQQNIRVLTLEYDRCIDDPDAAAREVSEFLAVPCRLTSMAAAVAPELYRHRISAS